MQINNYEVMEDQILLPPLARATEKTLSKNVPNQQHYQRSIILPDFTIALNSCLQMEMNIQKIYHRL